MKKITVSAQIYGFILGIDVSKESLDACLIRSQDGQVFEQKFNNNPEGFKKLKYWAKQQGSHGSRCASMPGAYGLVH